MLAIPPPRWIQLFSEFRPGSFITETEVSIYVPLPPALLDDYSELS